MPTCNRYDVYEKWSLFKTFKHITEANLKAWACITITLETHDLAAHIISSFIIHYNKSKVKHVIRIDTHMCTCQIQQTLLWIVI